MTARELQRRARGLGLCVERGPKLDTPLRFRVWHGVGARDWHEGRSLFTGSRAATIAFLDGWEQGVAHERLRP